MSARKKLAGNHPFQPIRNTALTTVGWALPTKGNPPTPRLVGDATLQHRVNRGEYANGDPLLQPDA